MSDTSANFSRWEYQNLALAAVAQCAVLVHQLATRGESDKEAITAVVNPLFVLDPDSSADIYPEPGRLGLGLQAIQEIFSNSKMRENAEIVRYVLGMLVLRGKLQANNSMQSHIRDKLQQLPPLPLETERSIEEADIEVLSGSSLHTFEQLANLYQETVSNLPHRIQVQGKVEHLKSAQVADKIRSLLLAGIRSTVLWYQLGGRRWHLILYRKRIYECIRTIRRKLIVAV